MRIRWRHFTTRSKYIIIGNIIANSFGMHPDVTVQFSPPQKKIQTRNLRCGFAWMILIPASYKYQPEIVLKVSQSIRHDGDKRSGKRVASNCESDGKTWAHWLRTKVVVDWGGMKSYPALGGIVFWSTGIHYGIMKIWTNQGIHLSPIPCWLIIGLKSWHSHERPKDP